VSYYRWLVFFAVGTFGCSNPSSACSPPAPDQTWEQASVTSSVPAKNGAKGAVQLKVDTTDYAQMGRKAAETGRVNLRVKEVITGEFSGSTILLNTSNVDDCNSSFEPTGKDSYITVLAMKYADGDPVLDPEGREEFGSMFYKDTFLDAVQNKKVPEFAEYSSIENHSFRDLNLSRCLYEASQNKEVPNEEDWRRCVTRDRYVALECERMIEKGGLLCKEGEAFQNRPSDLHRGFSFWTAYGPTIATMVLVIVALIGIAFFARRARA
jgi:hypothetical protein